MKNRGYLFLISMLCVVGLMPISLITGETTPPIVNITSHTNNQTVSGTITITATAYDSGSGIDFLQFYFGGDLITTDSSSPYSSSSITVKYYAEGAQTISVVAFDNDGNFAVDSVIVNVYIDYDNDCDFYDSNNIEDTDSVWIWFHTYNLKITNSEVWGIDQKIRKVEFDWYTDDIGSNIECKWHIDDSNHPLGTAWGTLANPTSNPTHVTLIFGPGEVVYTYPLWCYIQVHMYRNGNWILDVLQELGPF